MAARRALIVVAALVAACGPKADSTGPATAPDATRTTTVVAPDGTRTTTITTTKVVEAPSPPPRPADPLPADPLVKYNLDLLNSYRARLGRAPLLYDSKMSAFALDGSKQLARDHAAHAHFAAQPSGAPGFGTHTAENQGDPSGVAPMDDDAIASGKKQIAALLKIMFDEGPSGGHYQNMMNPKYRRVGIGLHSPGGRLYLTNDFSD